MSHVELSHGTLHYSESGAGAPVVFLHGWAADDEFFPAEHARRLAGILPDARVELIPGSRTWIMLDQPERTAHLIAELARRAAAQPAA